MNGIKYLYFCTSQMFNIIKYLQMHYNGHINELTIIDKFKLKYIYTYSPYKQITINVFKNEDIEYDKYNKQIPFLTILDFLKNYFSQGK